MKKKIIVPVFNFALVFMVISLNLSAQSEDIIDAYEDYAEAPREVAYVHLNKSTYINGEMLGFKAYVFDKFTKVPSTATNNLYCTISDKNGNVIKKQLLKVENGVASNVFNIDSTLSTGIFTFKAYTNWMRNFDEQNHFEQTFKVIDAEKLSEVKPVAPKDINIDLQALGEGGHLVYDIENSVGIIAKNQFGYGIANAFGTIKNQNDEVVSEFQLNEVGLAKTIFTPKQNESYTVNLDLNNRIISESIINIESNGLVLNLVSRKDEVSIVLKANARSLNNVKNKLFQVGLHNGSEMKLSAFNFSPSVKTVITYPKEELFVGTNIITIFDAYDQPILERLYFNSDELNLKTVENSSSKTIKDSLNISMNMGYIDPNKLSSLSVSILPSETKSYNQHNNLLSQLFIQPYIKGYVENAKIYFEENPKNRDANLDLLMLTQGWSSYDWKSIFTTDETDYRFAFEKGIDIVANVQNNKAGDYIVYPLARSSTKLFDVPVGEKAFTMKTMFPTEDDIFRIGYIDTNKKQFREKPSLYLQYYPSEFSDYKKQTNAIEQAYTTTESSMKLDKNLNAIDNSKVTSLDEVVINADKSYTRSEALNEKATLQKVKVVEENIKLRGLRLDLYLERLGYKTDYDVFSGTLSIINRRVPSKFPPGSVESLTDQSRIPLIYLDDILLTNGVQNDFSILTFYTMDLIDYIEYEIYGTGGGIRGQAGYIKIYTAPGTKSVIKNDNVVSYDIPLTFEKDKTFYTPKYQYYNSDFFKEYGTIAWQPNAEFDASGTINFKVYNTKTKNISLFVEGFINDSEYISQEIKIESEN